MANRPFTLTTAAGLGLLFALQADAGQANVSLATESAAITATTASVREAATTAAASIVLEPQTPPPAAAPAPAPVEEPAPTVTGGVNVDLFSHYVWRGFALTDGFAFQPSVFVSTKGMTFTSWSSWSSTDAGCFDADDCPALREHDFTFDYTRPVGAATVSVGYINYLFPPYRTDAAKAADAVGVTNELYGGVTFTTLLNPFVKAYFDVDGDDFDTSKGTYLQFGVSQPIPLAEDAVTLTPMFSVAYNFSQWITEDDWNDANLGVKLAIPVGKFTITPSMYLSIGLNDTVKAVGYGDGDTKFYGGVGFSYAF
jgi:Bacterial protein of unknown function (Gcw_chp)